MRQSTTPPLSQCPVCGRGEIVERPRKPFVRSRRRVLQCTSCGATMAPLGAGWYKLTYCAPHKMGSHGCRRCAGYFYNACFLDRALAQSDWERMAHRQPPVEVEELLERSKRLKSGDLPVVDAPELSDQLATGEVVHHVSHPVFTDDGYRPGVCQDGGKLFVTNRRLLFCVEGACSSLNFADFEEIDEEYPGFCVRLRGEHVSHCFYPPILDPAFAAAVGAHGSFLKPPAAELL